MVGAISAAGTSAGNENVTFILVSASSWQSLLDAITRIDKNVTSIATTVNQLEKQMSDLSDAVTAVSADLDSLSTKLDTETTEIAKVIALLQTASPDIPAAVTALQGIHTRVGTLSGTVDQHVTTLDAALPKTP